MAPAGEGARLSGGNSRKVVVPERICTISVWQPRSASRAPIGSNWLFSARIVEATASIAVGPTRTGARFRQRESAEASAASSIRIDMQALYDTTGPGLTRADSGTP